MTIEVVLGLARETLLKTLFIAGPVLIAGMVIGLMMGIFQSITSIQETTVAFVPKMLVVGGLMIVLFPWMLNMLREYAVTLLTNLPMYAQ